MEDDRQRLSGLLLQFRRNPADPTLQPQARELAERFTFDQLQRMVPDEVKTLRDLFDYLLGRSLSTLP